MPLAVQCSLLANISRHNQPAICYIDKLTACNHHTHPETVPRPAPEPQCSILLTSPPQARALSAAQHWFSHRLSSPYEVSTPSAHKCNHSACAAARATKTTSVTICSSNLYCCASNNPHMHQSCSLHGVTWGAIIAVEVQPLFAFSTAAPLVDNSCCCAAIAHSQRHTHNHTPQHQSTRKHTHTLIKPPATCCNADSASEHVQRRLSHHQQASHQLDCNAEAASPLPVCR